jgi:hypothetical protein
MRLEKPFGGGESMAIERKGIGAAVSGRLITTVAIFG